MVGLALLVPTALLAMGDPATITTPVTVQNFERAETDMYFSRFVQQGGLAKLMHNRNVASIDKQDTVRINRDTIYSAGIFDLDAGPVQVNLPDTADRYMSLMVVNQDHYVQPVVYAPVQSTFTREQVGTRYMMVMIRTLVDPKNTEDVKAVHVLQDAITIEQENTGSFKVPSWDPKPQKKIRDALKILAGLEEKPTPPRFGLKKDVSPISHLIGTAAGWGAAPANAARYFPIYPKANNGKTVYSLTVKDVPVDGFWSISVYNKDGYYVKNKLGVYSINSVVAKPNADGSVTIQFGGCHNRILNCIPTPPDWNYLLRLYRPAQVILDGIWKFPEAQQVK